MIVLTRYASQTNTIYTTPYENADGVSWTYYIFLFTNRITSDTFEIALQDVSITKRYQQFSFDIYPYNSSTNLQDLDNGFWTYEIYGSNDGIIKDSLILETGYMLLKDEDEFAPTKYNEQSNQFVTYNG